MAKNRQRDVSDLVSLAADGKAADADLEKLDSLLARSIKNGDMRAVDAYIHATSLHVELDSRFWSDRAGELPQILFPSRSLPAPPHSHASWLSWGAMAAACLLLAFSAVPFLPSLHKAPSNRILVQPSLAMLPYHAEEKMAVIGFAKDVEWNLPGHLASPGSPLGRGELVLERGAIRLDFPAGELISIEAPAVIRIKERNVLSLEQGRLAARVPNGVSGFTVILPNGTITDLGTSFAVDVSPDGENRVRVLEGEVLATTNNQSPTNEGIAYTEYDRVLRGGEETLLEPGRPIGSTTSNHQFLDPIGSFIPPLEITRDYKRAVLESRPLGYWRFETRDKAGEIKNETGGFPLRLGMHATVSSLAASDDSPRLASNSGHLIINNEEHKGFAVGEQAIAGSDLSEGISLELWLYSYDLTWQFIASLVLDGEKPSNSVEDHNPHLLFVERTGVEGSNRYHRHPDFAVRGLWRYPAGYKGGQNLYTDRSHLVHSWRHLVIVKSQEEVRLFVDGRLSSSMRVNSHLGQEEYYLLIGRMHTLENSKEDRQFSGAIDEVALYDRALSSEEVWNHFESNESTR